MSTPGVLISGGLPTTAALNLIPGVGPSVSGGGGPGTKPWAWVGSPFPTLEGVIASADTGPGTACPLIWNRVDGDTGDDQMCKFEWTTKEVSIAGSGSIGLTFTDPTNPLSTELVIESFSFSGSESYITATTWEVLEPGGTFAISNDIVSGTVQTYNISPPAQTVIFTASFGVFPVLVSFSVQIGTSVPLSAVDGTGYAQYVKDVQIDIEANSGIGPAASLLTNATLSPGIPVTAQTATLFHGSAPFYGSDSTTQPDNYIDLSSCVLSVTDKLTQPPNL